MLQRRALRAPVGSVRASHRLIEASHRRSLPALGQRLTEQPVQERRVPERADRLLFIFIYIISSASSSAVCKKLVLAGQRPRATSASKQVAVQQNCQIVQHPRDYVSCLNKLNKYVGEALPLLFLYDRDGGRRSCFCCCCCYLVW